MISIYLIFSLPCQYFSRQLASDAGKTAILLPWEIAPTKQEDLKVSSADLKNGRVQDQRGYHRLQSHTSGSSVVTSTTTVKNVSTVT